MQIKLFDESIYEEKIPFPMEWDCTGWHSDDPIFGRLLNECNAKLAIEVGSWKGASALNMCKQRPDLRVICCDHWELGIDHLLSDLPQDYTPRCCGFPTMYWQFIYNVARAGLQKRITPIPNTSRTAAKLLRRMEVEADFIYIDGSHEYEDVLDDLKGFWPLLRNGGIMAGDDVNFPDVRRAVEGFIGRVEAIPDFGDPIFWVLRKV